MTFDQALDAWYAASAQSAILNRHAEWLFRANHVPPSRGMARAYAALADDLEVAADAMIEAGAELTAKHRLAIETARFEAYRWAHETIPKDTSDPWFCWRFALSANEARRRLRQAGVRRSRDGAFTGLVPLVTRGNARDVLAASTSIGSGVPAFIGIDMADLRERQADARNRRAMSVRRPVAPSWPWFVMVEEPRERGT